MSVTGAIVTYGVVWWLIFFMVLPFGARPLERPERGHAESAPAQPRLLLKAAITTVLAGLATWGIAWLIDSGLISLRPGD